LSHSKLFALATDEATAKLSVEPLGEFPHGARLATFTERGDAIILVTPDSEVQIHPFLDETAPPIQYPHNDRRTYINKIAISPDATKFATSSSDSTVVIRSFNPDISPQSLPRPSSAITSLAFLTPNLVSITLADQNRLLLFEYHDDGWSLYPWSQDARNMPVQIGITVDKCLGTFVTDSDPSRIWLWGANWLAWIKPGGEKCRRKSQPALQATDQKSENDIVDKIRFDEEYPHWITYRYREVLLVDCISSGPNKMELVVVERPRHEILEDVTEGRFYVHQYGT